MKPTPNNFRLRADIGLAPAAQYPRLCDRANGVDAAGTPDSLGVWLDLLRQDAEALLERVAAAKKSCKQDGMTRSEIDKMVRYIVASSKPTEELREMVFQVLVAYRPPMKFSHDNAKGKFLMGGDHSADATNEQLLAFMVAGVINTGEWRRFRRCREPKCNKFFFDKSSGHGGQSQFYCTTKHGRAHRARKK